MHPLGCAGLVVSHNLEHLALLLPDHLVKWDTRLVVVRGVDGSARCPVLCFGQCMVDVVHPRDPLVSVSQAGTDAQSSGAASTAHYRPAMPQLPRLS
jgi:hypothetical protein